MADAQRERTGYSHKRSYGNGTMSGRVAKTLRADVGRRYSRTGFTPGYTRTVGDYGRYNRGAGQRVEKKFFDITTAAAPVLAAGNRVSLNLVARGDQASERVGNRMFISKLMSRFTIKLPSTNLATASSDVVRVMYLVDSQCNGTIPATGDILAGSTPDFQDFNSLLQGKRFRTLYDESFTVESPAGANISTLNTGHTWSEAQKIAFFSKTFNPPLEINFDAAGTGVIAEVRSNNLVLLVISRGGDAEFSSKERIRYTD